MNYLYGLPIIFAVGCSGNSDHELLSFQSQRGGKHTYLLTHYDVLTAPADSTEVAAQNPFGRDLELTDKELTIVREGFKHVGQCVYKVSSSRPLPTDTPEDFRQLLAVAEPIALAQKFVSLNLVYDELRDFRDLYGHRMPWYYDYLAIGASFVLLNGVFDIVTHNAQAEAIKIAEEQLRQERKVSKITESLTKEIDELGIADLGNDIGRLEGRVNKLYLDIAKSEHAAEEVFGKFLYFGKEVKMFGKTVNLNPLWALKEGSGKKIVPLVREYCREGSKYAKLVAGWPMPIGIVCASLIAVSATAVIGAAVPFSTIWTGRINSLIHRKEEEKTLDDLVGDWDNFRTFIYLKPEDMAELETKMQKLNTKGTQDCPSPASLADHYINPETGRFY